MSALTPTTSPLAATMTVESAITTDEKLRLRWRERIDQAKQGRRPFERTILSDLAFAAGQHWLVYDDKQRRMRHISELDVRYQDRELFTADRITEYRMAQLGELESDDDRPNMLVVQDGNNAEETVEHLNSAVAYAWDYEWRAEQAIAMTRRYCIDMGVAAIRCKWDPVRGPKVGDAPIDQQGEPATPDAILHLAQHGQMPDGTLPRFKPVNAGATCWESYGAFHLLPPPGVHHEDDFPWEILAKPVPVEELQDTYPHIAATIGEDGDIANLAGVVTSQQALTGSPTVNRLRKHAWLYTCFEKPTARNPRGQVVVLATNQMLLAEQRPQLDYELPDGTPHSGVTYFHWWRRSDRFWSGSFITPLKDPQRIINRRETQNSEIIDRHMPRTYVKQGDLPELPAGAPGEFIEMSKTSTAPPEFWPGAGPGQWMYADLAHHADNLQHASTLSALRLGENPNGVDTYSQLALLNDNETSKRAPIFRDHRRQIATLVELGVHDIRRYWPDSKQILVSGQDSQIERVVFEKQQIPDFFMAKVATGAPTPRSQGALLKMLDAIWAAAVQSWVAVQDGPTWLGWYAASLKAGKPLDLPAAKSDTQKEFAYLENKLMLAGQSPQVMDYDLLPVHLPVHREAEDQARAAGDMATVQRIVDHVAQHMQVSQQNAAQLAATQQGQPPQAGATPPGAPGSAVPAGLAGAAAGGPAGGPQFPSIGGFQIRPREPNPSVIPHEFHSLAGGQ